MTAGPARRSLLENGIISGQNHLDMPPQIKTKIEDTNLKEKT